MPDRRAIEAFVLSTLLLLAGGLPTAAAPECTITGTPGGDHLVGTPGADVICGLGGDDVIEGLGGGDILYGGPGADTVEGGGGMDILLGGEGDDTLSGGDDGDYLHGGPDGALLDGGDGTDACIQGKAISCYLPPIEDPNDTPGRADVRKVRSYAHQATPRWKISTFRTWTVKGIWDAGYFVVFIDTTGDPKPDYHVLAYSDGQAMRGGLYKVKADGGETRIGPAPVSKSGPRGVMVKVPLDELSRTRPSFRWSVMTLFTGKACHTVCFDRIPGQVMLPQAVLSEL